MRAHTTAIMFRLTQQMNTTRRLFTQPQGIQKGFMAVAVRYFSGTPFQYILTEKRGNVGTILTLSSVH